MGFGDILREHEKKPEAQLKGEGDREDKVLISVVKEFKQAFWRVPSVAKKWELIKKSRRFYAGERHTEDKKATDETGKREKETEIEVVANFFALIATKIEQLLVMAESPVVAKPLPDELTGSEENIQRINEMFKAARHNLHWDKHSYRVRSRVVQDGTGYIYVGFDPQAGKTEEQIKKDEKGKTILDEETQEPQMEILSEGRLSFENLRVEQVSLDAECKEFDKSRTVVITREKTKEQLHLAFKGNEELEKKLFGEKEEGKTGFLQRFRKKSSGESKETITLYEVIIKPNKRSEWYKDGLHAYLIDDVVLSKDKAPKWRRKRNGEYRIPLSIYIMNEDEDCPLGYTRLWQLFTLHVYRNQFLAYLLLGGQNDVIYQLIVNPHLVDAEDITTDPRVIISMIADNANRNISPANAVARLPAAPVSGALIQSMGEITKAMESIGEWYDPKHFFKSGQRRVGEMQILQEEHRNAHAPAVKNAWIGDAEIWAAFYDLAGRSMTGDTTRWEWRDGKDEYQSVQVSRDLFNDKLGIDFVVASKNMPEPPSLKAQKVMELYEKSVFGMPGTPSAIGKLNRILEHLGELPEDPRGERYDDAAKVIIKWLTDLALIRDPAEVPQQPRISPFWDHARVWEKLEDWFAVNLTQLTDLQVVSYETIMRDLEDAGKMREVEQGLKDVHARKILLAAAGPQPGQGSPESYTPAQGPTEGSPKEGMT